MRSVSSHLVRAVIQPKGCWLEHEVDLGSAPPGRQWLEVTGLGRVEASSLRLDGPGVRVHDLMVERRVEPVSPPRRPLEGPDRTAIDAELRFLDRLELPKPPGPQRMAPPARAAQWLESLHARRNELQRRLRRLEAAEPPPLDPGEGAHHESTLRVDLEVEAGAGPLRVRHPGGWATWRPKLTAEWLGPRDLEVRLDADVWDETGMDLQTVEMCLETTEEAGRPMVPRSTPADSDAERSGPPHPFDIASDHPDADRLLHPGPLEAFGHRPLRFTTQPLGDGRPAVVALRTWRLPVRPVAVLRPFASPIAWLAAELHRAPAELPEAPLRLVGPDGTVRDRWRPAPKGSEAERWIMGPLPEITCERSVTVDPASAAVEVRLLLRCHTDLPAEFELEDQLPVSVDPQVQVKLLDWDPIDPLLDERSGRIRFDGRLTPGGTHRFRFAYRLLAPRGHRVIMVPGGDA